MGTFTGGTLAQIGYNGDPITLGEASWKNSVNTVYQLTEDGLGWLAFDPTSLFNSLEEMVDGEHYLIDVKTTFTLEGADSDHQAGGGSTIPFTLA